MVNKINDYRKQKGLTQQELAEILCISLNHLNKIERGKREPSLRLALRIANALDCRIEDIFFEQ
jgi:putative transcriptional regulator